MTADELPPACRACGELLTDPERVLDCDGVTCPECYETLERGRDIDAP